jgi:hypothetical protein
MNWQKKGEAPNNGCPEGASPLVGPIGDIGNT